MSSTFNGVDAYILHYNDKGQGQYLHAKVMSFDPKTEIYKCKIPSLNIESK